MKPINFDEQNDILGAGDNVRTNDLPIWRGTQSHSAGGGVESFEVPVVISKWELTKEEIDYVNKTGNLWLLVRGETHPPLLPMAEHPFE